jgi:hypothetical protein
VNDDLPASPAGAPAGDAAAMDGIRRFLGMTNEDLWLVYIALGGVWSLDDFTGYLQGTGDGRRIANRGREHKVLAQAIDEQFMGLTTLP